MSPLLFNSLNGRNKRWGNKGQKIREIPGERRKGNWAWKYKINVWSKKFLVTNAFSFTACIVVPQERKHCSAKKKKRAINVALEDVISEVGTGPVAWSGSGCPCAHGLLCYHMLALCRLPSLSGDCHRGLSPCMGLQGQADEFLELILPQNYSRWPWSSLNVPFLR